ncbi:MAG: D-sedoheptulose 7-phosphate isomerase [Candidatus Cloacimonetes bacterium]|nr:D-sedoheptulose 7-phosphate isomerase [Candidatus Cloacimonadota bacterium]
MTEFSAFKSFREARDCLDMFLADPGNELLMQKATAHCADALRNGNQILSCGNGGSMCDAMHFAEELSGRYRKDRPALPAMAISDPAYLSCVANDYGYTNVFRRWVEAFGKEGDILIAISTSGKSQNVLEACEAARSRNMKIIGLSGKDGGSLIGFASPCFVVPGLTTDRIQELHIKILHIMIEGIERSLFPELYCLS